MTNREAFNKYLREEIERQIKFVEDMSNQELVDKLKESPKFQIHKEIGNELNWFMVKWFKKKPNNWLGIDDWVRWLDSENDEEWS